MNYSRKIVVLFLSVAVSLMAVCGLAMANSPLDGQIRIQNDRMNTVSISIDGRSVGRVHAGKSRVFRNVPNGVRLLKISGKHADVQNRRVTVPIAATAQFKIFAVRGRASVKNNSGIRLKLVVDGRYARTLSPGAVYQMGAMSSGSHRIEAYPTTPSARKSPAMVKRFTVTAGQKTRVELGRYMAEVKVSNPYDRRVRVWIDGRRELRLAPHETVSLTKLIPGRHNIELKRRGRTLNRIELNLSHGQVARWSPLARYQGRVSVANNARHSISVTVGGQAMQQVAPGGEVVFEGLSPGDHRVLIVRRRGRVEERVVGVSEQQTARLSIGRPGGRHASRHGPRYRVVARN